MAKWKNYREEERGEDSSSSAKRRPRGKDVCLCHEQFCATQELESVSDIEEDVPPENKASNVAGINDATDSFFTDDPCEELGFG